MLEPLWYSKLNPLHALLPLQPLGTAVMFHIGRSGSRVVGDLLNQHPKIYWAREVLKEPSRDDHYAPFKVLDREVKKAGGRFFGCEVKPFHLNTTDYSLSDFVPELRQAGVSHFIILERKNYLRKIVSSLTARQKKWHIAADEEPELVRVRVDPDHVAIDRTHDSLLGWLQRYHRHFTTLRALLDEEALYLTYEKDVAPTPRTAYEKILDYLALEPRAAKIRFGKTNPFPLHEIVSNFDEVAQALQDTEYTWMLYK